jgi:leucyl aminopeptidase
LRLSLQITAEAKPVSGERVVFVAKGAEEGRYLRGEVSPAVFDGRLGYILGLGKLADLELDDVRRIGASVVRTSKDKEAVSVDLEELASSELDLPKVAQAFFEGVLLGSYSFDVYRSQDDKNRSKLNEVVVFVPERHLDAYRDAVAPAKVLCEAVALARDLINEPPSVMTPRRFTEIAQEVAQRTGLELRVWDEEKVKEERLGGLLGVAMGSNEPPRMLRLHYKPATKEPSSKTVALVGKGITFDSGGLSLKPANGMMTMKTDMSGAAAVLAAMSTLAELGCKHEVFGYMALTENMPSGTAQKPGDVLRTRLGKTIEVLNTDAEGRLVLADALALAVEDGAEEILDIATLTGACVVALGVEIGGLLGNSSALIDSVLEASRVAGEDLWPLPLPKRYKKHIESEIADMKNIGAAGQAGTLSAGLLLEEFVSGVPWVHLDIAGPARSESDDGYLTKGGTGFGVRTICNWLC